MTKQLALVKEFHKKFHALISDKPSLIPTDRSDLRYRLMRDEVEEYLEGVKRGDLENIAHELGDILYAVYGTIIEHGLQDKMEDIFDEIHRSNMSKDYSEYKMIKGPGYTKADLSGILANE